LTDWLILKGDAEYVEDKDEVKLPLPKDVVMQFMAYSTRKRDSSGALLVPETFYSFSSVSGVRSAIVYLYRKNNVDLGVDLSNELEDYLCGYSREVADMKQSGKLTLSEGKSPMPLRGYLFIAKEAVKQGALFAWLFTLLCWHLIARSVTVANIMICHVSWELDSLTIHIPKHKGDQEGRNGYARHVY